MIFYSYICNRGRLYYGASVGIHFHLVIEQRRMTNTGLFTAAFDDCNYLCSATKSHTLSPVACHNNAVAVIKLVHQNAIKEIIGIPPIESRQIRRRKTQHGYAEMSQYDLQYDTSQCNNCQSCDVRKENGKVP